MLRSKRSISNKKKRKLIKLLVFQKCAAEIIQITQNVLQAIKKDDFFAQKIAEKVEKADKAMNSKGVSMDPLQVIKDKKTGIVILQGEMPAKILEEIEKFGRLNELLLIVFSVRENLAKNQIIDVTKSEDGIAVQFPPTGLSFLPQFFKKSEREKMAILHHELQHLKEGDSLKSTLLEFFLMGTALNGKNSKNLDEEKRKVIVEQAAEEAKSRLYSLQLFQEKRADKIPASKDINVALGGKEWMSKYKSIDEIIPGDPHPSGKKRYAYFSTIYNRLKAEETIKATTNKILNTTPF